MATTRIMPLHAGKGRTVGKAISDIIDYVKNPEKTDHGRLITSYQCDSRVADAQFLLDKQTYAARTGRVRGADDVIAYHLRQSFVPGEITPEEANRLGVELARRFTKGRHAFIVCTHIDKAHVHNHIIWNSTTLECDRKFRNFWGSTRAVHRLSDTICIENGYSIVEAPKRRGQSYNKWLGDAAKPSHKELLRQAIDRALAQKPASLEELLRLLEQDGFTVHRRGKTISISAEGWGNNVRFDRLGDGYTLDDLLAVLSGQKEHTPRKQAVPQAAPSKVNLLVDIQAKLQAGKGAGYARWAKVFNLKQMAQTLNYLSEHGLLDYVNLEAKTAEATVRYNALSDQIKAAEKRMAEIAVLRTHIVNYTRTSLHCLRYAGKRVRPHFLHPLDCQRKETIALEQIENATFHRKTPTVAEYCEKWLLMQSVHVRTTTLTDYTSKVRRHIIAELGDKRMGEVSLDDIQLALVSVSKKSASVYKSVVILYKSIFRAAKESRIIDNNPTIYLTTKGGGVPQKDKAALTDEQVERLLDAVEGLPTYVFVMLGLYAGLRREEILALKWDSVYLDGNFPYLTVRRAWHTENNRPVILEELKTKAAERNIPLPTCLAECLKETKENSTSEYVVPNRDGDPLSYTQFKRLWQYVVTRTVKERSYYRYEDGKRVKHTVTPVLGEKAAHNGNVVYSLDFEVTPHQLRHTYITNLIHSSVDPKTVQYLAGHESSKITMDIYAKVKYNRPDELVRTMGNAFSQWDSV